MVRTRLIPVGDEFALVFDQETLGAVGYTIDTAVELRVEAGSLVIEPVRVEEPSGVPRRPVAPKRQDRLAGWGARPRNSAITSMRPTMFSVRADKSSAGIQSSWCRCAPTTLAWKGARKSARTPNRVT